MRKTTRRFPAAAVVAALAAGALLLALLPGPPAAADDRSLVKESESEPYVMILLDITGSMNHEPGGGSPPVAPRAQDDPRSKMFQAKRAIYEVLGDPDLAKVHFGFASFPNQDELRIDAKSCSNTCVRSEGNGGTSDDARASNVCAGWEPNDDTNQDDFDSRSIKQTTVNNPNDSGYPAVMRYGDIVPMDWESVNDRAAGWASDNRLLIQRRLAPNLNLDGDGDGVPAYLDPNDPEANPSFEVARFFNNTTVNGIHRLRNTAARPLVAVGSTPLAGTLRDFDQWFADWRVQAAANDPKFGCKQVHVIMITDGLDTCESGSTNQQTQPPLAAAEVFDGGEGPRVWAVGYSLSGLGKTVLNNIAQSGGTNACPVVQNCTAGQAGCCDSGTPDRAFFPDTQDALAEALKGILDSIRSEARSFAAAAVPQGQANASDKIYLASFFPLEDLALWPGSLDSYLRPLPLKPIEVTLPDGSTETRQVPNRGVVCEEGDESGCRLWDAGDELLLQGATNDELDAFDYNLGQGADERRVFYSVEDADDPDTVPAVRRSFLPDTLSDADAGDVMELMGCAAGAPFDSCDPADSDNVDQVHEVARWVHQTKSYVVPAPDPDPDDEFDPDDTKPFLLGEIFHSDPVVVGAPENFRFYVDDLFADRPTKALLSQGLDSACGAGAGLGENPGYVCFFEKHRFRRKLVVVGSNDGQLHAFDGGIFEGTFDEDTEVVTGEFDDGTGREVFSFIPRAVMPTLVEQAGGTIELYGVDGKFQFGDVFIDTGSGDEWRTVLFGHLREGGAGYFALDVTQPDALPEWDEGNNLPVPVGSTYVPSCTDGGDDCEGIFPRVLWEFSDRCTVNGVTGPCDEDVNFQPDLAEAWSRPVVGVVEVCTAAGTPCPVDSVERKFVTVFGGGFDPEHPIDAGNHLFIVDVETGKPIYKRALTGGVPSEPAAVDTDQNGILDTIYVGTTAGLMYKVDLTGRPQVTDQGTLGLRVDPAAWTPFPIFSANTAGQPPRPIFYPPSVIFVTDRGRFALAFGTGYREDLWQQVNQTARFFAVLDEIVDETVDPPVIRPFRLADSQGGSPVLPLDSADLQQVDPESTTLSTANILTTPQGSLRAGWWMELQAEERVIASPFALSGLLVFLTFQPDEVIGSGGNTCANAGVGRSFTVFSINGSTILQGQKAYSIIPDLPTSPYTEVGTTKNPDPGGEETEIEAIPEDLEPVMAALKKLFPKECRFGNYTINVKTRRSDTGIEWIAPVPVCIVQKNWKGM